MLLLVGLWIFVGCGGCARTPDQREIQLREVIERAEIEVEARDVDALSSRLSDALVGPLGMTKPMLLDLLQRVVARHESVYLVSRIRTIKFQDPRRAEVDLVVGMAGVPIASPEELSGLRASVYRFSIEWSEEEPGDWRVTRANWQRSDPGAFFE
jgi:hypothetical protein